MRRQLTKHRVGMESCLAALAVAALVVVALMGGRMAGQAGTREAASDPFAVMRQRMVEEQIERRGIEDRRVLEAMRTVPRHLFVPESLRSYAYEDEPLPIGDGQTISQPYIVAFMTEAARLKPGDRVLEVGTGSGYQAAVLAAVGAEVWSIEILPELAARARGALAAAGFGGVRVRTGDGFRGWPEEAPFDAVLVTAAPAEVPPPLLDQLKVGGRLVIPVGTGTQELIRMTRTPKGYQREPLLPVRFVPMTGEARGPRH